MASQGALVVKNPATDAGDAGSVPESGRSPEERIATDFGLLAGRVPATEKPGGLWATGLRGVRHD